MVKFTTLFTAFAFGSLTLSVASPLKRSVPTLEDDIDAITGAVDTFGDAVVVSDPPTAGQVLVSRRQLSSFSARSNLPVRI